MAVLGVDVGGTFTDFVAWDGTRITARKIPSSADPAEAVVAGIGPGDTRLLLGTTVATNALLQGSGGETALITSPGFEDVIEIGRQDRPSLYDSDADRAPPLVSRDNRFASSDTGQVRSVQGVAIALMHAHVDGTEERAIADRLRRRLGEIHVSMSSEVSPEVREFERSATTVLNAYLQPVVAGYLRRLADAPTDVQHINVMRSSGGLISIDRAAELPAAILLSGPAGGAVATAALADAMGRDRVISFDMGGTSTDVSRIEGGRPEVSYERSVGGYVCRLPAVAIHTIGAGGGSIAWRDSGGALQVGPASAGASPGPACYGGGGVEPTVTDANAVLGRLPSELGGYILDVDAASNALERLELGSAVDAASGVVTIVEENMARAVRRVSVEEGVDPSDAALVAFGGAGGLHATALARRLGMSSVIIPPLPGVFSALGLLLSPGRADAAVAVNPDAGQTDVGDAVTDASHQAAAELRTMTGTEPTSIDTFVDLRYLGQSHELTVPWQRGEGWGALIDRFHDLHRLRNGFARPDDPIEAITARAEATVPASARLADLDFAPDGATARRGEIQLIAEGGVVDAALWWRPSLTAEVIGPAIIAEPSCTTLVAGGERAVVQPGGALELEW